jgi:uncharacterized membrane protein YedE/YeeE
MGDNTTTSIRRSARAPRETPEQRERKRKIQLASGVILIIVLVLLGFYIQGINSKGAFIWVIGLSFGYVLQRSRFCFTAAMRDPVLTGSTALTKALIIAMTLASIAYMALQMSSVGLLPEELSAENLDDLSIIPGNIRDVGVHTVLGGFIFGIGAVVAGGCASGTLMRMGEGFVQQWIAIVFFIIGSVLGAALIPPMKASGILYQEGAVYLPQALGGWLQAIVVQFGLLFIFYVLADWYGKKKAGEI